MASVVGPQGQIIIEKAIREQLGVRQGWQAVQLAVGDHVEIYFLPPEHEDSLLGAARPFIRRMPAPDADWDEAAADAAVEEFQRKVEA